MNDTPSPSQHLDAKVSSDFAQEKNFRDIAKEGWSHDDFRAHLCKTIESSTDIQKKIKEIVWSTVKEKVLWLILGGIIFILLAFAKSYVEEFAKYTAEKAVETSTTEISEPLDKTN